MVVKIYAPTEGVSVYFPSNRLIGQSRGYAQGIKPALAVDRAVELSLDHSNSLAIHLYIS